VKENVEEENSSKRRPRSASNKKAWAAEMPMKKTEV
jgi:hypothetical protein